MNKQQFIKAFADKAQFTQKDAGIAFEAMAETIAQTLKAGEKIQIAGFGTFEVKKRAARTGINPLTKEKVKIAACNVPSFKFGNSFKENLNNK
ncbi:MAG: HU family DNA-binding protein [Clostridiales bacterium]|nr:HU family DNA-binding protein [Clostridiales bacterium]